MSILNMVRNSDCGYVGSTRKHYFRITGVMSYEFISYHMIIIIIIIIKNNIV